ncbi:MAG: hypothetical protein RSA20_07250, partial [Oscillospiraceae bacterium]
KILKSPGYNIWNFIFTIAPNRQAMVAFVQKAHGSIGTKTHGSRFAVLSSVVIFTKRSALRLVLFTYCYVSFYKLIGLHNPQGIRRIFDNLNPRHPPKALWWVWRCVCSFLCGCSRCRVGCNIAIIY